MVKSIDFYYTFRLHAIGRAYIFNNVCNHHQIPIQIQVIAIFFTIILFTPTLMEQIVGFEPTPRAWQTHVLTTDTISALVSLTAGVVPDS